ncbi:MAG TPA: PD-(D/E)XK nuclease family protein [Steroidobacteraceae bacterium]
MFRLSNELSEHLQRGGTLLVPQHARVRAVALAYAAAELAPGACVWRSPDVLTPAAWARRSAERLAQAAPGEWPRVLSATEEWLLWRESARAAAAAQPLLDAGALADSLRAAHDEAALFGIRPAAAPAGTEAGLLHEACVAFEARCLSLQAVSAGMLLPRLVASPATEGVMLRGLAPVPPALRPLLAQLPPRAQPQATPRLVVCADPQEQADAITAWARAALDAGPRTRLAVVFPGPAGARERLAAQLRDALAPGAALAPETRVPVGVEGGAAFAARALPAHAFTALEILLGREIEIGVVASWLASLQWSAPPLAARAALALLLRQRGLTTLALPELQGVLQLAPRHLQPAARELESRLKRARESLGSAAASPRHWSERIERALAALGWPGLPGGGVAAAERLRWRELLEDFGGLEGTLGILPQREALSLVRALAQHTTFNTGTEDVAVLILPALVDPVVHYDGIWVASLSADVLPQPVAPDPFLPRLAQVAAGIPGASLEGRRAQAAAQLAAWSVATPALTLSYARREGDLELLPSALLSRLPPAAPAARLGWLPLRLHRSGATESCADARGTTWNPLVPLPRGTRALTLQTECPFRAYAELRLGASEPERAEPGVTASQRGLLLHAALEALWRRLGGSAGLAGHEGAALERLIADCVAQAAQGRLVERPGRRRRRTVPDAQFDFFSTLSPALTRESRRAERLIRELCALERTRTPFAVAALEEGAELALGGGRLSMRLDRVDLVDGARVILDYKSGRPHTPDWYGERPSQPQLLAYLAALGGAVAGLATVHLTAGKICFSGVTGTAAVLPQVKAWAPQPGGLDSWALQQARWSEVVAGLIAAFLRGDAAVDPLPGVCKHCHLADVCRIGAHAAPEDPGHPGESDD